MAEWTYVDTEPFERFCQIQTFGLTKRQGGTDVEFVITVKEYVNPPDPAMKFLAQADKQTNQNVAPYTPCGWGKTLLEALRLCIVEVNRFPYQGEV